MFARIFRTGLGAKEGIRWCVLLRVFTFVPVLVKIDQEIRL